MQEIWVGFLGQEDPLEKEMTSHSSILAWKIPRTEKPGRLQLVGLQSRQHTLLYSPIGFYSVPWEPVIFPERLLLQAVPRL